MPVAQNLHFDVPCAAHEAFQEDGVVAESRSGFAARLFQAPGEIGLAGPPPACRGRRRQKPP